MELDTLEQEAMSQEKTTDELEMEVRNLEKELDAKENDLNELKAYQADLKAE
jgi:archaellum component FlaC